MKLLNDSPTQLQQGAPAEGGARAEARAPATSGWEWEDGQVAVHTTVRGVGVGNKEATRGDLHASAGVPHFGVSHSEK